MLKAGLTLYDFFVRDRERRHRWIPASDLAQVTSVLRTPISGAFEYCDGQMNDVRIVLEHIEAARRVGAVCVNYAEVEAIESGASFAEIRYRDRVSQALHTITSKAVLSCAGPWGEKLVPDARNSMRFSRGAHIVFRTPWGRPPLFLPIRGAGPGRYYFVLPHFAGTLVGTTEAEVEEPSFHPLPTPLEVAEILQRLKDDLPKADLTAETAHYAFAGIRALPVRGQARSVSRVARRHVWEQVGRVVTLFGGKYTTYQWTAGEGVKYILSMLGMSEKLRLPLHPFPYFVSVAERRELQQKVLQRAPGISPETLDRLITRLGSSLEGFLDQPHLWEELLPGICAVEVAQAVAVDQAISPSDILLRRLETISFPDFGEVLLPQILEQLVAAGVDRTFVEREGVSLKAEFAEVRSLLNNHSR
jgi:glycerol-3-phosphate dehydrogenase